MLLLLLIGRGNAFADAPDVRNWKEEEEEEEEADSPPNKSMKDEIGW